MNEETLEVILTNQLYMLDFLREYYAKECGGNETIIEELLKEQYARTENLRNNLR